MGQETGLQQPRGQGKGSLWLGFLSYFSLTQTASGHCPIRKSFGLAVDMSCPVEGSLYFLVGENEELRIVLTCLGPSAVFRNWVTLGPMC